MRSSSAGYHEGTSQQLLTQAMAHVMNGFFWMMIAVVRFCILNVPLLPGEILATRASSASNFLHPMQSRSHARILGGNVTSQQPLEETWVLEASCQGRGQQCSSNACKEVQTVGPAEDKCCRAQNQHWSVQVPAP